jgi:hypothetical protein
MSEGRTDHVVESIDNCLSDYDVSADAMRWTPEPDKPALSAGQITAGAIEALDVSGLYRQARVVDPWEGGGPYERTAVADGWLAGFRIVEDEAVPPGQAHVSVDREIGHVHSEGAYLRSEIVSETTEVAIAADLAPAAREQLLRRIADHYGLPLCQLAGHNWQPWHLDSTASYYRRVCARWGCEGREARAGWLGAPE